MAAEGSIQMTNNSWCEYTLEDFTWWAEWPRRGGLGGCHHQGWWPPAIYRNFSTCCQHGDWCPILPGPINPFPVAILLHLFISCERKIMLKYGRCHLCCTVSCYLESKFINITRILFNKCTPMLGNISVWIT